MKNIVFTLCLFLFTNSFLQAQFEIIGGDRTACSGKKVILEATSGAQYSNYKWFYVLGPSTYVEFGNTNPVEIPNLSSNSSNEIRVTALENGITTVSDVISIFQFESPKVSLNYDDYLQCKGDSVLVKDENTAGGIFDYTWSNGKTGPSLYLKQAGTYTVSKKGPFPSKCTATDAITINLQLVPSVTANGRKLICVGDPVLLEANLIQTPTGTINYEWQNNSGTVLSSTEKLETTTNSSTTYKLKVTEEATITCSEFSTIAVTVNPPLEKGSELDDAVICLGENYSTSSPPITGGNGGPYTYSWSANNEIIGSSSTLNVTPDQTSEVYLSVTDANDCVYSDDFELTVKDLQVSISDKDSLFICENDSLLLDLEVVDGTEPYTYEWTLPDNTTSPESSLMIKTEYGEYSVKLTDDIGCFDYDTVQVNQASGIRPIIAEITGPTEITFDETAEYSVSAQTDNFELTASSDGLGEIEAEENTFSYLPSDEEEEPTIQIEIFNICGSDDSSFVLKVVAPEIIENILFIPNTVILSASKEESKVFKVYSETIIDENFDLKIFSSKGDLVFEESSYSQLRANGWKPDESILTFSGTNTFTYITKGKFESGETFEETGSITVVQ